MSQMLILLVLIGSMSAALASFNPHGQPLFSAVTSYTFTVVTTNTTKKMSCYTTEGQVSQCRRKRGIEEKPILLNRNWPISPSAVIGIESTPVPMLPIFHQRDIGSLDFFNANPIVGSMDDSFQKYHNLFHQLSSKDKKNNVISVGNCGMSTVNFSQFLSCLGLTVQETTTLTATFTKTQTYFSGYNRMTVKNCTPAGFPYQFCP
ncbi:uncharacterized protein LOC124202459 [Daphnia pulex]|uniref:uncharacterized protein LOC124202459 n=1 Tax=Daphnia pulex TaxID=6669 RepID=UPI001EDE6E6A|nr:uncharacterized protein LOC124202459 [Daphnia pulex]